MPLFPRKNRKDRAGSPSLRDARPAQRRRRNSDRYMEFKEIDRWRALPFSMPPSPEREMVLQQVRQIVESLDGAIDEGTGAALDHLIGSWVASWITTVETEYADHCAVISVHRAQASEWLVEGEALADHERAELARIRSDYLASRARLGGQPAPKPEN